MKNRAPGHASKCVKREMSCEIRFNENAACERCGKFGAYEFDGAKLCVDCYETKGACCPEFGRDDLWSAEEAPPAPEANRGGAT